MPVIRLFGDLCQDRYITEGRELKNIDINNRNARFYLGVAKYKGVRQYRELQKIWNQYLLIENE